MEIPIDGRVSTHFGKLSLTTFISYPFWIGLTFASVPVVLAPPPQSSSHPMLALSLVLSRPGRCVGKRIVVSLRKQFAEKPERV